MRVLFTSLPATGHFNSIMPTAIGTAAAGHEVAVCTTSAFAEEVTRAGLRHLPGGADSIRALAPDAPPIGVPTRPPFIQQRVFAERAPQRLLPDLAAHVKAWQPELLVRESSEFAACLLAEKLGMPHASIGTGAWSSRDERRALFADALSVRRAEMGLAPDPEAEMLFRYLQLAFTPPRWDGEIPHPPTVHFIRYDNPERAGEARPAWLDEHRDRPFVYASLGTEMNDVPGLFEAIIEAVADEPIEVVAAIGRNEDPARFGTPPANVRIEGYVPQIQVLATCDLFITHGGFNSTKEALRLGIPLVVTPIGGDQPYTAERVEALGLGRAVGPDERDPATIRSRVREVLAHPRYAAEARRFSAEMQALPPIGHAVELLEQLAREKQPIPRADGRPGSYPSQ
jgi:UDP:flavonoid glycosyltransferase YjiC (YdhE family)